jgi:uncharacterized membrane protein
MGESRGTYRAEVGRLEIRGTRGRIWMIMMMIMIIIIIIIIINRLYNIGMPHTGKRTVHKKTR